LQFLIYILSIIFIITLCLGYILGIMGIIHGAIFGSAPFVPSNKKTLRKLIAAAEIKKGEIVYDLGSGDGRIVFAAADKGAIATGIELSFIVYWYAKFKKWLFKRKGTLIRANMFQYNLSKADIIFCYLLPKAMKKLEKKLEKELKSGTKIICHAFKVPHWKLFKKINYNRKNNRGSIWIYIKP